jgi:ABC-type sugar transport system permease subunit
MNKRSKTMKKIRNGERVDKGFEFVYWNLSYRRKFIRTLWVIPFAIIAVILVWMEWKSVLATSILTVVIMGIGIAQAIYNYKKWKDIDK